VRASTSKSPACARSGPTPCRRAGALGRAAMCGIFGIEAQDDAANHVYLGLYAPPAPGPGVDRHRHLDGAHRAGARHGAVAESSPRASGRCPAVARSATRALDLGSSVVAKRSRSVGAPRWPDRGRAQRQPDHAVAIAGAWRPRARSSRPHARGHPAPDGAQSARGDRRLADGGARRDRGRPTRCS